MENRGWASGVKCYGLSWHALPGLINVGLSALVPLLPTGEKPPPQETSSRATPAQIWQNTTIKTQRPVCRVYLLLFYLFQYYSFQLITMRCQLTSLSTAVCLRCLFVCRKKSSYLGRNFSNSMGEKSEAELQSDIMETNVLPGGYRTMPRGTVWNRLAVMTSWTSNTAQQIAEQWEQTAWMWLLKTAEIWNPHTRCFYQCKENTEHTQPRHCLLDFL